MGRLLRNTTFGRLYAAQVISLVGTGLMTVALGLLAYDLAGDDAGTVLGTALAIKMVAYVVMAPVMRAILHRFDAARVLIGADLTRLAMALCLPLVTQSWQIYLLIFALQTASATFTPTFQSAITRVVPDPRDYAGAVSASRVAYDLESLGSPLIAAALLTVMHYSTLFVGTAAGFAFSAAAVAASGLARLDRAVAAPSPTFRLRDRISFGTRIMLHHRLFRGVLWANLAVAATTAAVLVGTVVYVRTDLGLSNDAVAIALATFGGGSILATLAVPRLLRGLGATRVALMGAAAGAIALAATAALLASAPTLTGLLCLWGVLGAATSLVTTTIPRLIRDHTTARDRDDVFAAQFSTAHAAFLLTYSIAGWGPTLLTPVGTLLTLSIGAAIGAVGAHCCWAAPHARPAHVMDAHTPKVDTMFHGRRTHPSGSGRRSPQPASPRRTRSRTARGRDRHFRHAVRPDPTSHPLAADHR